MIVQKVLRINAATPHRAVVGRFVPGRFTATPAARVFDGGTSGRAQTDASDARVTRSSARKACHESRACAASTAAAASGTAR